MYSRCPYASLSLPTRLIPFTVQSGNEALPKWGRVRLHSGLVGRKGSAWSELVLLPVSRSRTQVTTPCDIGRLHPKNYPIPPASTTVPFQRLPWDKDTWYTDIHMFREPEFGAVYLIDDEKTALLETGTSNDTDAIMAALSEFGRSPAEVDCVIVSHVHLDHAGGAGFLLEAMPKAAVYVHERGYKHLVDPTRLLSSAADALQDMAEEFGTMRPCRSDRVVAVKDGDTLDLGSRVLTFHHSTGHAPHELTISDDRNRCIYTGDEAGLWFPSDRILMPVTPAPSFDLARNLESFTRMMAKEPRALLFSHFGPHEEPRKAIEAQMQNYATWTSLVRARSKENIREGEIVDELYDRHCKDPAFHSPEFLRRRIRNSVHGLLHYHRRLESATP